ncbi:PD-(D/E)XK nuclease-like domain-containing protein [Rhodovulum euryhalinum]|uniref:PDDEXK-like uncharacterized protein DUF3799 n=1 Tax=Rhodovulum euryhalinum TaxID=35805 RepID=A0A4R2KU57_9RHOB|nr:PD-(D/E)XK nuclease-like domain-containing protein [Rhodovulum euryhalinum]TCO70245.1 PDDEXK-like uncharacterized protein DUF3799 [Rhodovulum euryhalinum]
MTEWSDMKPGVYAGISNSAYHAGPGISKSGLDLIRKSPAHYQHSRTAERREPTPDQRLGTLAHALILEPESFWDCYAQPFVAPENALATTDDMKARLRELGEKISGSKGELTERLRAADPSAVFLDDARAEYAAEVGEQEIVTADEIAKVEAMRGAFFANESAGKLFAPGAGVAELSCYWVDEETGVLCRCRPDFWRFNGVIADLKTCRDASFDGFQKSIWDWRYHVQAAFYLDGIREAIRQGGFHGVEELPEPAHFVFGALEKVEPYASATYLAVPEMLEIGRREYRKDLRTYADCLSSDKWPGYGDKIQPISLPEWVLRREAYATEEQGVFIS